MRENNNVDFVCGNNQMVPEARAGASRGKGLKDHGTLEKNQEVEQLQTLHGK